MSIALLHHNNYEAKKSCLYPQSSKKKIGMVGRQNFFSLTFITIQPLVNYNCENTASKINTSNTYSCGI